MTLHEALQIVNESRRAMLKSGSQPFRLALGCGFIPLHFKTFLMAEMAVLRPATNVDVSEGLYGDLPGNLERIKPSAQDAVLVVVEWSDLDPRLGFRSTGGWHPKTLTEILQTSRMQLQRIENALLRLGSIPRLAVGPTLPLTPLFYGRPNRLGSFEADLRSQIARFNNNLASERVVVISPQAVDAVSRGDLRLDLKSELAVGFPYTIAHAEAMARLVAGELIPPGRKKGLITDLDDTLWKGLLGEVGVDGVCWSLEKNAQIYGLYQQLLSSLAATGTLVAVASKNNPYLVTEALKRSDLLVSNESIFPVEAHWGPKSQSIARILAAWNIAADSVVFVDDSPMELAEVKAAFPDIECVLFPREDIKKFGELLVALRSKFGTSDLTEEDTLRIQSLKSRAVFESSGPKSDHAEQLLREAQAEVVFAMDKSHDPRPLELINKTNQFNLNGVRVSEAQWSEIVGDGQRFVLKVSYSDRYGRLGNIAVLVGRADCDRIALDHWVMSCRAFSRRIEYRCMQYLFDKFHANAISLSFQPTPRNGPIQEFLAIVAGSSPSKELTVTRGLFEKNCPALYHFVKGTE